MEINYSCAVCGGRLLGNEERGVCSSCKSRPRVRTISILVKDYLLPRFGRDIGETKNALCFAMTSHERTLLSKLFKSFESVSLFGNYGREHTSGVDAPDLARYSENSFCAHYSCLLFDYFIEHEQALKEAFRVVAPGGLFITHVEGPRLENNATSPRVLSTIKPRTGYYDYIPDGQGMVSIKVGKDWFIDAMQRAGFKPFVFHIVDESSGIAWDWFVGYKETSIPFIDDAQAKNLDSLVQAPIAAQAHTSVSAIRPLIKEYSIPMPDGLPFRHVTVTLSIPKVTNNPKTAVRFSEHVIDHTTGAASDRVIACSVGGAYISDDLGFSWNRLDTKGFEKVHFVNSISLPGRTICLQAKGLSPKLPREAQPYAGLILTLDHSGVIKSAVTPSPSQWHGSSSIEFKDGVLLLIS
jgi:SAM-dependent methyltransferase